MYNRRDTSVQHLLVLFIICIILVFLTNSCQNDSNSKKINDKVHSINGEVLSIEPKSIYLKNPFHWNSKSDRIYMFTYVLNEDKKVGWYKNGAFRDDWILDYQED